MAQGSWLRALCAIALLPATGTEAAPALKDVLRAMSAYVQAYGEKTAIVVATERYEQEYTTNARGVDNISRPAQHRETVAEFAIVKTGPPEAWVGYRDVIEVDGRRVADRDDRLIDALTGGTAGWDEARRLSGESSRFNIGPVLRNFNVPTTALFFFSRENLDRFSFHRKAQADGVWEIAFRETKRPTLIRTPAGVSIPSEGSVWVNVAEGTVVRTRLDVSALLAAGDTNTPMRTHASIDVVYRRVDPLGMWLPAAMTETYDAVRDSAREHIGARADYSNYRTFQTSGRVK
jgi:hypothetical protein